MKRYADLATDDRGTDPVNDDYSWRKSRRSAESGCCVEVAEGPDLVAVRDSKDPDGGILKFSEAAWRGFVADVRAGRYDGSIG